MKKFFLIVFLSLAIGCGTIKNTAPPPLTIINNPTQPVDLAQKSIKDLTEKNSSSINNVETAVKTGETKTPAEIKPILDPIWNDIKNNASLMKTINSMIADVGGKQLENAKKEIEDFKASSMAELSKMKDFADKETKRANKAEDEGIKTLKQVYTWISVSCFGGFLLSLIGIFSGFGSGGIWSKLAIGVAVACGVGLGLSIFLIQTISLIPWIVGGILLIAAAFIIWQFFVRNKAIQEVARTTEMAKEKLSDVNKALIFGTGSIPGKAFSVQSTATEAIVKKVRKNIPKTSS
jgi:hypothetical protein